MIEFSELTEEKKIQYKDILYTMVNMEENPNSLVFLYKYKGQEKILQVSDEICRIWYYLNENTITYSEFGINENFDLTMVALDDAILLEGEKDSFFKNRQTGCLEDFAFVGKNEKDAQGYDGVAIYSQYNEETDIRLELIYQHMKKPNNYVYPMHLKNPIQVSINKNASKNNRRLRDNDEIYARYDFDATKDFRKFKTATIKDYGLLKTFNKDLVSLQKSSKISRYYKVVSISKENELTISYPFGNQYTLDEVNTYIKKLGFNTEVPSYLIEMNNQKNEEYLESVILAANLKALNDAYVKGTGRSLKLIREL